MKPERTTEIELLEARDSQSKPAYKIYWLPFVVLFMLVGILVAVILPITFAMRRDADRNKAFSHARSCVIVFNEYRIEHGVNLGALASHSNGCFRELLQRLATVRSEAIFYAPSRISKQPDNDIGDVRTNFAEACAKGEVGFLYVYAPRARDGAPLMAAPLYDINGRFDSIAYNGDAVVLMNDGSVESIEIEPSIGKVMIEVDGKRVDMFGAENPAFPDSPVIKYPEPK